MTTPATGPISFLDIANELSVPMPQPFDLNRLDVRVLALGASWTPNTAITMSQLRGRSCITKDITCGGGGSPPSWGFLSGNFGSISPDVSFKGGATISECFIDYGGGTKRLFFSLFGNSLSQFFFSQVMMRTFGGTGGVPDLILNPGDASFSGSSFSAEWIWTNPSLPVWGAGQVQRVQFFN